MSKNSLKITGLNRPKNSVGADLSVCPEAADTRGYPYVGCAISSKTIRLEGSAAPSRSRHSAARVSKRFLNMGVEIAVMKLETFMKAIALLLIIGILASADQSKTSQSPRTGRKDGRFDYATQIGIVDRNDDNQFRLEIKNPNLAAHDEVVIIDPNEPQKIARAAIDEKVSGSCTRGGLNDSGGDCYKLRPISGEIDKMRGAFGIVKTTATFTNLKGRVSADLDNDRVAEHFRACTSMEGLHLTVWSGRPLKGKRQWHRYFALGYDVEPNCEEGDTNGIADK
jgi:hypothetical protein